MFSVAPNIVLAPNMTQNAERKHRTQDANTAPIRPPYSQVFEKCVFVDICSFTTAVSDLHKGARC